MNRKLLQGTNTYTWKVLPFCHLIALLCFLHLQVAKLVVYFLDPARVTGQPVPRGDIWVSGLAWT